MKERKVNRELYAKVKAVLYSKDYTINEIQAVLEWLIAELARKWSNARNTVPARDFDSVPDRYDDFHRYEDGPGHE